MPTVTFLPDKRSVCVDAGTSVLDAAAAQVRIDAPCGGTGGCGQCKVRIASGSVESATSGSLSSEETAAGWVLACGSRITTDVTIEVPATVTDKAQVVTSVAATSPPQSERSAEPLTVKRFIEVPRPSIGNSSDDLTRLKRALQTAGLGTDYTCSLSFLRSLAANLRADAHRVTVTLMTHPEGPPCDLIACEPGNTTHRAFGLAIDVGTTTCAVHLVDLARNHVIATGSDYNAQIGRGADVISRINYAKIPEHHHELQALVLDTLNAIIERLCHNAAVRPDEIADAAIAGNTTMIHLLLGLAPEYIRLDPYVPTANQPPLLGGGEIGLRMNANGLVAIAPAIGSYVGGDIAAGLLHTALATDAHEIRLFLDIGTNGEVVVGNDEWLMACAASAGPAFEGSGVACGMRAAKGAIERVRIDAATANPQINVIGGGKPSGICGSGMIDLLSELWAAGLLDPDGKLNPSKGSGRIRQAEDASRNMAYLIVPASETASGKDILIDERDIQNIMRTKAAVYSACSLMLKSVGLDSSAIEQVYVAGGFGRFLDLEKSIRIGLLPDLPLERFTYLGNSSLAGAHAMLTSRAARKKVVELARRMTYVELNTDPSYMDEYTAALFLPHTDISRFPNIGAPKRK